MAVKLVSKPHAFPIEAELVAGFFFCGNKSLPTISFSETNNSIFGM